VDFRIRCATKASNVAANSGKADDKWPSIRSGWELRSKPTLNQAQRSSKMRFFVRH
jgi:hypothetical protein